MIFLDSLYDLKVDHFKTSQADATSISQNINWNDSNLLKGLNANSILIQGYRTIVNHINGNYFFK